MSGLKTKLAKYVCEHGGYQLARYLTRNQPKILMYHRFSENNEKDKVSKHIFEQQLTDIKKNFNPIPLQELIDCIITGKKLPKHGIVITIDDGYRDFYEIAFPLLKKYDIPATVYITSNFVDGSIWLWPDKISYILENTEAKQLDLAEIGYHKVAIKSSLDDRDSCWQNIIDHCLTLDEYSRKAFINNLAIEAMVKIPELPIKKYCALTWDHVREIQNAGIEIGAHTANHPVLSRLNDKQLELEISGCKQKIEESINANIFSFCYPNGQPFDYNNDIKAIIKNSGFNNATTAFYDSNSYSDLYELRRYPVGNGFYQFRKSINGIIHLSLLF